MNDYIVSWTDINGNEFFNDWMPFNQAIELFYAISGSEENKVDNTQIFCELYSDVDNKTILKYDNITNEYFQF